MKKRVLAVVLVMVIMMVGSVFASGDIKDINNTNTNFNMNSNSNDNYNSLNFSYRPYTNDNSVNSSSVGDINVRAINEAPPVSAPQINTFELPIYQQGKIGDITATMPEFKGLKKLDKKDIIAKIVAVYDGNWLSRIRLEDLEVAILKNVPQGNKIRYSVKFKDSVTTGGVGGGATGSLSNDPVSGAVLPGYHQSTQNPQFIITVYEIE
jgi:hypothetical protein